MKVSEDARYISWRIVKHMWIVFVLLPVVLGKLLDSNLAGGTSAKRSLSALSILPDSFASLAPQFGVGHG